MAQKRGRRWVRLATVMIRIVDLLFAYGFAGIGLAILTTGLRVLFLSNDHLVALWSAIFLISGALCGTAASVWAFIDVGKPSESFVHRSDWQAVMWRYPILIGPTAYYLGQYRLKKGDRPSWFARLTENRQLLDVVSFIAWRGTLAAYGLIIGALIAAAIRSAFVFMLVVALFVALIPIVGSAFYLLSLVVLVHVVVTEPRNSRGMKRLNAVPRVGPLWVRGFRQYYETVIRPTLSKSIDRRAPH